MKITFLGTGTSLGVPAIACDCEVCISEDPKDKRTRASLHIQTESSAWVIDTGPDFRSQCLREGVRQVDSVLYTHPHTDHIMGFDDLRRFCQISGNPLPVYGSQETLDEVARVFDFAFNGQNRFPGYIHPMPTVVKDTFSLGGVDITPLPLPHGRIFATGYLHSINGEKKLAYFSDCKSVPEEAIDMSIGVDVLVIDALRFTNHPTHLSIPEALEVVEKIQPGQTWFTHISCEVMHARDEPKLPDNVGLAYDGLTLELS